MFYILMTNGKSKVKTRLPSWHFFQYECKVRWYHKSTSVGWGKVIPLCVEHPVGVVSPGWWYTGENMKRWGLAGHVTYVYVDVDLSAWRWWTCRNMEYSIRSMSRTKPPALSYDDLCVMVKVCMRGYMCEWRACVEGDEVLRRKCLWIPELAALERDQSLATDIHSSIDRLPLKVNILCYYVYHVYSFLHFKLFDIMRTWRIA